MCQRVDNVRKQEIIIKLKSIRKQIIGIISKYQTNDNWQSLSSDMEVVISKLNLTSRKVRNYHLEVCILKRRKKLLLPYFSRRIDEIVKTYKYLN